MPKIVGTIFGKKMTLEQMLDALEDLAREGGLEIEDEDSEND